MRGRVVIEEEGDYRAWLDGQQTFAQSLAQARGAKRVTNLEAGGAVR